MRAGIDAAWFLQVRAEIAGSRFLLDDRFLAACIFWIIGEDFKGMKIDVAVGTIARAKAAADTPILDDHFEGIAPANRTNRASHHAEWIAALAATRSNEIAVKAQAIAHEACNPIVRIGAGIHTGVAARAILQVENEQALRFHQAL